MKTGVIIAVAVVLIIAIVGGYFFLSGSYGKSTTSSGNNGIQGNVQTNSQNNSATTTTTNTQTKSFTVMGNDYSGSPTTINVNKGDTVQVTFQVEADKTYHGGLEFRSSVVNTGAISPGSSKTVIFTATDSFEFTPYWPTTNIQKPYTIKVVVQ